MDAPQHKRRMTPVDAPEEGAIRVGPIMALPQVIRDLGGDPGPIFAEAGVDLALLKDADNLIPFRVMGRLIDIAARHTRCDHIGLLASRSGGTATLGLVGYLVRNSPDVGSALRALVLHLHHHDRGAVPTLSVSSGQVCLGYAIYQPDVAGSNHISEAAMVIGFNILRSLCGPDWSPIEVRFAHSRPADPAPLRRFFRVPLRFDAEETAIVFQESWLDRAVPDADPLLYKYIRQQVDALDATEGRSLGDELRRILHTLVLSGKGNAEGVAQLFGVHRRTLNRRLEAEGMSFEQLLAEARYKIARQMLGNSRAPLTQVAAMLGYADASAFSRAFRRWSGVTPTQWREEASRPSGAGEEILGAAGTAEPGSSRDVA